MRWIMQEKAGPFWSGILHEDFFVAGKGDAKEGGAGVKMEAGAWPDLQNRDWLNRARRTEAESRISLARNV